MVNLDLATELLAIETETKLAYQQVVLDCANQAENGGTLGLLLGNELFGIECQKLSDNANGGLR